MKIDSSGKGGMVGYEGTYHSARKKSSHTILIRIRVQTCNKFPATGYVQITTGRDGGAEYLDGGGGAAQCIKHRSGVQAPDAKLSLCAGCSHSSWL